MKLVFKNPNFPLEFQAYDNPERFDMRPEEPDVLKRLVLANETVEFVQKAINKDLAEQKNPLSRASI